MYAPPGSRLVAFLSVLLRDRLHESHRLNSQRVRQFDDVEQANVSFASLDAADVVPVQLR